MGEDDLLNLEILVQDNGLVLVRLAEDSTVYATGKTFIEALGHLVLCYHCEFNIGGIKFPPYWAMIKGV